MSRLTRVTSSLAGISVVAVAFVLFRSAVWVFWEQSYFESDQAIVGLMAKHLAERRAFPLTFYGQQYMLAVESWLIAPGFKLFGASVLTLRLPLVAINIVIAVLLLKILVDHARLTPRAAFIASLFFLLAPIIAASRLVEAQGANVEPFLYTLLLWLTRANPLAFGVIGGIGFTHREFTAYAIMAIVVLELWHGAFFRRSNLGAKAIVFAEVIGIALIVRLLMGHADLLGPGTAGTLGSEVLNGQPRFWLSRVCWNPAALVPNLRWLGQENLAALFGFRVGPLSDYVRSSLMAGHAWAFVALVALLMTAGIAAILGRSSHDIHARSDGVPDVAFPAYIVLVGLQAVIVYAFLGCLVQDRALVRYTLLALLIPVGLMAWLLQHGRPPVVRGVAVVAVLAWAAASLTDHARLLAEYLHHPPRDEYRDFASFLEHEGIRYGEAPYWTAYQIDFLTDERVTLGSYEKVRIKQYEDIVHQHMDESVLVFFDDPCTDRDAVHFERWCLLYFERARHPRSGG
jgi:hypothetical protein